MKKGLGLIIDTNQYTGDFERQLCAFLTGHVGEIGSGKREKEEYLEEYQLLQEIDYKEDENGFLQPSMIYPTEGIYNNGLGFHFKDGEEKLALQKFKEEMKKNKLEEINRVKGFKKQNSIYWNNGTIEKEVKRLESILKSALNKKRVDKYPAYQSVMIHLKEKPTDETIQFLKKRANEFETYYGKNLKITGFKLVEQEVVETFIAI